MLFKFEFKGHIVSTSIINETSTILLHAFIAKGSGNTADMMVWGHRVIFVLRMILELLVTDNELMMRVMVVVIPSHHVLWGKHVFHVLSHVRFIDEANSKPIRSMVNIIVWKVIFQDTFLVSKHVIRVISISFQRLYLHIVLIHLNLLLVISYLSNDWIFIKFSASNVRSSSTAFLNINCSIKTVGLINPSILAVSHLKLALQRTHICR